MTWHGEKPAIRVISEPFLQLHRGSRAAGKLKGLKISTQNKALFIVTKASVKGALVRSIIYSRLRGDVRQYAQPVVPTMQHTTGLNESSGRITQSSIKLHHIFRVRLTLEH